MPDNLSQPSLNNSNIKLSHSSSFDSSKQSITNGGKSARSERAAKRVKKGLYRVAENPIMSQFTPDAAEVERERVQRGLQALFKLEIVMNEPFLDPRLKQKWIEKDAISLI